MEKWCEDSGDLRIMSYKKGYKSAMNQTFQRAVLYVRLYFEKKL